MHNFTHVLHVAVKGNMVRDIINCMHYSYRHVYVVGKCNTKIIAKIHLSRFL